LYGLNAELYAISSIDEGLEAFAKQYGFSKTFSDYREMLNDPDVDVVDIIVPPSLHKQCILDSLEAGKHIICEKPLTGYFGAGGKLLIPPEDMYKAVMGEIAEIDAALENAGKKFFYAENWVYAPSVQKAAEVVEKKKLKQLLLKGEESHSGSHAKHAAYFGENGGGSLIRQGCHPISAVLFLKQKEAMARGETIGLQSVLCDIAALSTCLPEAEKRHIAARPVDVEDYAQCIITFTDGTKADIVSADILLGGVKNHLEIYANEAVLNCNISPNNTMQSYFADETGLDGLYLTEKAQTKLGWQSILLSESVMRGYAGELQDFMECIAFDRQPLSGFKLACDTVKVVYGAYCSAIAGSRFAF
jgi:predicted dehydrogenase